MSERRALILDTTAFIAGFNIPNCHDEVYSVPDVEEELKKSPMAKLRLNTAVKDGRLKIREPSIHALKKAKAVSKEVGDLLSLSEADIKIIALAVELREEGYKPVIITDDYSIQNVARKLSVKYETIITHGIHYQLRWILYCPACRRKYPPDYKFGKCENCGTRLKRKPLSKSPV